MRRRRDARRRARGGLVAQRIYALELESPEVRSDRRQIESYGPLLSALARGDARRWRRRCTSLVYSHTHVVRLRVSGRGGVLADVGGPYIIAPVSGTLRQGGRVLGALTCSRCRTTSATSSSSTGSSDCR